MKLLWTLLKVALVLALVIPVGIVVLTLSLGILGALFGLAVLTLRIAVLGLLAWGAFRLLARVFGGAPRSRHRSQPNEIKALPQRDPHYEAAMRELDQELGGTSR